MYVPPPPTTPALCAGSILEGGGQVVRIASALSCITGIPLRLEKIRLGRSAPGLRPQHVSSLRLIEQLCSGHIAGNDNGSTVIAIRPGPLQHGDYECDTGSAGSCTLLAQVRRR